MTAQPEPTQQAHPPMMSAIELSPVKVRPGALVPISFNWREPIFLRELTMRARGKKNGEEIDAFVPKSLTIGKDTFDAEQIAAKEYVSRRVEPDLDQVTLIVENVSEIPAETIGEWTFEPAEPLPAPSPMRDDIRQALAAVRAHEIASHGEVETLNAAPAPGYPMHYLGMAASAPQIPQPQPVQAMQIAAPNPGGYHPPPVPVQPMMGHVATAHGSLAPAVRHPQAAQAQPVHGGSQVLGGPGYAFAQQQVHPSAPVQPFYQSGYVPPTVPELNPTAVHMPVISASPVVAPMAAAAPVNADDGPAMWQGLVQAARQGYTLMTVQGDHDPVLLGKNHIQLVRAILDLEGAGYTLRVTRG